MRKLEPLDSIFLDMERPTTPPIIGGLFMLDPSTSPGSFVRHRDILKYVGDRLHIVPNLRRKLIFSSLGIEAPRLVDDPDFDLEFHVRHIGLPRPRDRRQLKILVARLMSRPMDLNRPLWEMYVIEGLEEIPEFPSDAFAVLIKVHHAAFDGAAAGAALWAMTQDTADESPALPGEPWQPEPFPGAIARARYFATEGIGQLWSNLCAIPSLGGSAISAALSMVEGGGKIQAAPKTRFQGKISSHRMFDWVVFTRAEANEVRNGLGKPKMNDMVLCIIAGAIRRYLMAKGELPDETLQAICPINIRGNRDPAEGGNFVTLMRAGIGTHIENPIERLAYIADQTVRGKAQAEQLGGDFAGNLLALYPYAIRSRTVRGLSALNASGSIRAQPANLIITNIPNPPGGHYLAGAKVLEYAGFGPVVDGLGMFHTVTGMDWELSMSVTSCRTVMPDIEHYMDCLTESFGELRKLSDASQAVAAHGKNGGNGRAAAKPVKISKD